jgi:hypothetical protein
MRHLQRSTDRAAQHIRDGDVKPLALNIEQGHRDGSLGKEVVAGPDLVKKPVNGFRLRIPLAEDLGQQLIAQNSRDVV